MEDLRQDKALQLFLGHQMLSSTLISPSFHPPFSLQRTKPWSRRRGDNTSVTGRLLSRGRRKISRGCWNITRKMSRSSSETSSQVRSLLLSGSSCSHQGEFVNLTSQNRHGFSPINLSQGCVFMVMTVLAGKAVCCFTKQLHRHGYDPMG